MITHHDETRRWQFGLRGLLMWIFVVSIATGWWVDHQRLAKLADPWIVILETDSQAVAQYAVQKLEEVEIEARIDVKRDLKPQVGMRYVESVRVRSSAYNQAHAELDQFWRDAFTTPPAELLRQPLVRSE